MLQWLSNFWNAATSTVGAGVATAVHWAEHAIASVVLTVFRLVGNAWKGFLESVQYFHAQLDRFAQAVIEQARYVLHHVIPSVIHWAERELAKLSSDLSHLWAWIQRTVNDLILRIAAAVRSVEAWALRTIWDPLKSYADKIWADLLKWGYTAYWYITHPADLAELLVFPLASSLEKHAWELASKLGEFALALVLANLKRFIGLIEDIISAVL